MFLSCFIIATIITPPDIVSQVLLGLTFFAVNEIVIITYIFLTKYKNFYK